MTEQMRPPHTRVLTLLVARARWARNEVSGCFSCV